MIFLGWATLFVVAIVFFIIALLWSIMKLILLKCIQSGAFDNWGPNTSTKLAIVLVLSYLTLIFIIAPHLP